MSEGSLQFPREVNKGHLADEEIQSVFESYSYSLSSVFF